MTKRKNKTKESKGKKSESERDNTEKEIFGCENPKDNMDSVNYEILDFPRQRCRLSRLSMLDFS